MGGGCGGIELTGLPAGEFVFDGGGEGGGGAAGGLGPAAVGGEVAVAGNADAGGKRDGAAATERLCHGNAEAFAF